MLISFISECISSGHGIITCGSDQENPDIVGLKTEVSSNVIAGTYLQIVDTIRNKGVIATGPCIINYFLFDYPKTKPGFFIGSKGIDNLLPGGQTTFNFSAPIPRNISPGVYHLYRVPTSDSLLSVVESGDSGQEIKSDITIGEYGESTLIGYFESLNKSIKSGENDQIITTIKNSDKSNPIHTKISCYLSESGYGDEIFIGESPDVFLKPEEEIQTHINVKLDSDFNPGSYYLMASFLPVGLSNDYPDMSWISDSPVLVEIREQPVNQKIEPSPVPVSQEPDITTVKTSYPDILYIGESFQITDSIQNIGGSTAGIVRVEYLLSQNSDGSQGKHLGWWTMHNVKSGETRTSQETVGIPDSMNHGIYYLTKKITVTSAPAEINTNNNFWTGNRPVSVEYSPHAKIPDLTHVNTIFPCKGPGEDGEIVDTITNIGNACAKDVTVAYYISPYTDFDPSTAILVSYSKIDEICVGEQIVQSTTVTIPDNLNNGQYYWYSVIDPCSFMTNCGQEIPELDKSNNINTGKLAIGPCVFCVC